MASRPGDEGIERPAETVVLGRLLLQRILIAFWRDADSVSDFAVSSLWQQIRTGQFLEQIVDDLARFIHPRGNRIPRDLGAVKLLRGQIHGVH